MAPQNKRKLIIAVGLIVVGLVLGLAGMNMLWQDTASWAGSMYEQVKTGANKPQPVPPGPNLFPYVLTGVGGAGFLAGLVLLVFALAKPGKPPVPPRQV